MSGHHDLDLPRLRCMVCRDVAETCLQCAGHGVIVELNEDAITAKNLRHSSEARYLLTNCGRCDGRGLLRCSYCWEGS